MHLYSKRQRLRNHVRRLPILQLAALDLRRQLLQNGKAMASCPVMDAELGQSEPCAWKRARPLRSCSISRISISMPSCGRPERAACMASSNVSRRRRRFPVRKPLPA